MNMFLHSPPYAVGLHSPHNLHKGRDGTMSNYWCSALHLNPAEIKPSTTTIYMDLPIYYICNSRDLVYSMLHYTENTHVCTFYKLFSTALALLLTCRNLDTPAHSETQSKRWLHTQGNSVRHSRWNYCEERLANNQKGRIKNQK